MDKDEAESIAGQVYDAAHQRLADFFEDLTLEEQQLAGDALMNMKAELEAQLSGEGEPDEEDPEPDHLRMICHAHSVGVIDETACVYLTKRLLGFDVDPPEPRERGGRTGATSGKWSMEDLSHTAPILSRLTLRYSPYDTDRVEVHLSADEEQDLYRVVTKFLAPRVKDFASDDVHERCDFCRRSSEDGAMMWAALTDAHICTDCAKECSVNPE